MTGESVRLTDIFTNAAAIADSSGAIELQPAHLLEAIDHLRTGRSWQLGEDARPLSPLGRAGRRATVPAALKQIAQDWFERLGNDPLAELDADALAELVAAIAEAGD